MFMCGGCRGYKVEVSMRGICSVSFFCCVLGNMCVALVSGGDFGNGMGIRILLHHMVFIEEHKIDSPEILGKVHT